MARKDPLMNVFHCLFNFFSLRSRPIVDQTVVRPLSKAEVAHACDVTNGQLRSPSIDTKKENMATNALTSLRPTAVRVKSTINIYIHTSNAARLMAHNQLRSCQLNLLSYGSPNPNPMHLKCLKQLKEYLKSSNIEKHQGLNPLGVPPPAPPCRSQDPNRKPPTCNDIDTLLISEIQEGTMAGVGVIA